MKKEQILKQAIEKAVKNGCRGLEGFELLFKVTVPSTNDAWHFAVIFDHEFAKAFWGEANLQIIDDEIQHPRLTSRQVECLDSPLFYSEYKIPAWMFHLKKMVLEKESLKYLEKFL